MVAIWRGNGVKNKCMCRVFVGYVLQKNATTTLSEPQFRMHTLDSLHSIQFFKHPSAFSADKSWSLNAQHACYGPKEVLQVHA
jgi:hypothetical protein